MYEVYKNIPALKAIEALHDARKGYEGDKLAFSEAMDMIQSEGTHEGLCLMHEEREYALYLANEFEGRGMCDAANSERRYHDAMLEAMRVVMRLR